MSARRLLGSGILGLGAAVLTFCTVVMVAPVQAGGSILPVLVTCTNNPKGDKTTCPGGSSGPDVDHCGTARGEQCDADLACKCQNDYPPDRSSCSCTCKAN